MSKSKIGIGLSLCMLLSTTLVSNVSATTTKPSYYTAMVGDNGSTATSFRGSTSDTDKFNLELRAVSASGLTSLWEDRFQNNSIWLLKRVIGNDTAVIPGSTARKLTSLVALSDHILVTKFRKHYLLADISGDTTDFEFVDLGGLPAADSGFKRTVNSVSAIGNYVYVSTTDYQTGTEGGLGHSKLWLLRAYDEPTEIEDSENSYIASLISSSSSGGFIVALRIHLDGTSKYSIEPVLVKKDGDLSIENSSEAHEIPSDVSRLRLGWVDRSDEINPVAILISEDSAQIRDLSGNSVKRISSKGLSDVFVSVKENGLVPSGSLIPGTGIEAAVDQVSNSNKVYKNTEVSELFRVTLTGNEYRFNAGGENLTYFLVATKKNKKTKLHPSHKLTKDACIIAKFSSHIGIKADSYKVCFDVSVRVKP